MLLTFFLITLIGRGGTHVQNKGKQAKVCGPISSQGCRELRTSLFLVLLVPCVGQKRLDMVCVEGSDVKRDRLLLVTISHNETDLDLVLFLDDLGRIQGHFVFATWYVGRPLIKGVVHQRVMKIGHDSWRTDKKENALKLQSTSDTYRAQRWSK